MAFRHFDVNYDGTVEFEEFVAGLEICGISMILKDYKDVYELINFDNDSHIDFQKFCLINIDKGNNI
jgi:Ca2+-binding EF-hand superfamily protein